MELEKCDKCEKSFEKGSLARDEKDGALLYCEACRPKKRKAGRPKKVKEEVVPVVVIEPVIYPSVSFELLKKDAESWATECGLKAPLDIDGPNTETFRGHGRGYVFTIQEKGGKERLGTARYDVRGARSYWSLDGVVTG